MWSSTLMFVFISFTFLVFDEFVKSDCPAEKDLPWSFNPKLPNGPDHWGKKYPHCNGKSQSPIRINTKEVESKKVANGLPLTNYNKPITKVKIENTGYLIIITPQDGIKRTVNYEGSSYALKEFHFHWGNETSPGAEHLLNDYRTIAEVHFFHVNEKNEGLVVASLLRRYSAQNAAVETFNQLSPYYDYKGKKYEGSLSQVKLRNGMKADIHLYDLIKEHCPFFSYKGSNAMPPCKEDLMWLVCKRASSVPEKQVKEFFKLHFVERNVKGAKGCIIENNYRPVQPLNGRKVYSSQ